MTASSALQFQYTGWSIRVSISVPGRYTLSQVYRWSLMNLTSPAIAPSRDSSRTRVRYQQRPVSEHRQDTIGAPGFCLSFQYPRMVRSLILTNAIPSTAFARESMYLGAHLTGRYRYVRRRNRNVTENVSQFRTNKRDK